MIRRSACKKGASLRVYVINLDRHTQRLARMCDLLRDVDFERIAAVEAATAGGPEHSHKLPLHFEELTRFERACAASHALAWQKLLESGDSHACILEDDVLLSPDFPAFMAAADWVPAGCDVVKIETFAKKAMISRQLQPCRARGLGQLYSTHLGAAGYVLSRAGAQKMLAHAARPARPVDHLLFDVPTIVAGLSVLQLDPALCMQLQKVADAPPEGEFQSSVQTGKAFAAKRGLPGKILWEISRPWRQLVDFVQPWRKRARLRGIRFQ
jgi:glycosyl transferase family 25